MCLREKETSEQMMKECVEVKQNEVKKKDIIKKTKRKTKWIKMIKRE